MEKNIRDMVVTTSSGKDVKDTKQISGEAKDSLHGMNETKQYETSGSAKKAPLGGRNSGS